jgi:DNA processing protein
VRGDIGALSAAHAIAIVGTRRPTERGRLVAARIGAAIANAGAVVVSGLAVGIDGAAHAAVVNERSPTVGVLGSGHRQLFPRAHQRLATEIVATGGAVVSELWPDQPPSKDTFPQRNRVISGLADATIVVEAGLRSGALITAKWALEQGRGLFLVPGPIDEPRSAGCLHWLREYPGEAAIVATLPELVTDLGLVGTTFDGGAVDDAEGPRTAGRVPGARPPRAGLEAVLMELGATARDVGAALVGGHGSLDELVATTGHEPATVLGAITLLELRGLATTTYGRYRAAGQLASATVPEVRRARPPRLPGSAGPC